jgi:hypothetical protein
MIDAKERMHKSIEQTVHDVVNVQDIAIKLSREIHGLHVAPEHEQTLSVMREQIDELQKQLEVMQEFLYSCETRVVIPEHRMTEIDIA